MYQSITLLFALLPALLIAESSVWKVCKGEQSLYIGGTCHVLRPSDYPLPAEFDTAYAASDTLVFEIDLAVANDPDFALQLLAKASYTDGQSLKRVLSPEAYAALASQSAQSGLPIEMLNHIKPGMVIIMLTMQELTRAGISQEGVDMHYHTRGIKDGKAMRWLETPEFQIDLITSLGDGMENDLVFYSLKDLGQLRTLFNQLIRAWQSGDLIAIEQLFITNMTEYPELYADMLIDRNQRWIPQIEAMLQTPETEFVLVGVAHAAGEHGVLKLLKQRGYVVEQVHTE
jgi:uncharacterized protein YbaP (TraB family)